MNRIRQVGIVHTASIATQPFLLCAVVVVVVVDVVVVDVFVVAFVVVVAVVVVVVDEGKLQFS